MLVRCKIGQFLTQFNAYKLAEKPYEYLFLKRHFHGNGNQSGNRVIRNVKIKRKPQFKRLTKVT